MKKRITLLVSTVVIGASVLLVLPSINAQQTTNKMPSLVESAQFPEMQRALQHLEQAKAELKSARDVFGGHRIAAIKACDEAIKEVRDGMKFAQEKLKQ